MHVASTPCDTVGPVGWGLWNISDSSARSPSSFKPEVRTYATGHDWAL